MSSVCSRVRVCSERSPIVYLLYIVFIIIMDNSDMEPNTQERLLQDREETTVQTDGVNEKSKPMQKIRKKQKKTKLTGPKATKQTPKAATNAVGCFSAHCGPSCSRFLTLYSVLHERATFNSHSLSMSEEISVGFIQNSIAWCEKTSERSFFCSVRLLQSNSPAKSSSVAKAN